MITITVRPSCRPGAFEARVDGRLICVSRQPFYDGARVLLAGGADPDDRLVMRHEGDTFDALRSTVGAAARWTICERDAGRIVREEWVDLRAVHARRQQRRDGCQATGADAATVFAAGALSEAAR